MASCGSDVTDFRIQTDIAAGHYRGWLAVSIAGVCDRRTARQCCSNGPDNSSGCCRWAALTTDLVVAHLAAERAVISNGPGQVTCSAIFLAKSPIGGFSVDNFGSSGEAADYLCLAELQQSISDDFVYRGLLAATLHKVRTLVYLNYSFQDNYFGIEN